MQEMERIRGCIKKKQQTLEDRVSLIDKKEDAINERTKRFDGLYSYGRNLLDYLHDPDSLHLFSTSSEWAGTNIELQRDEFWLFRINELTFEEKAPRREAMENILGTFRGMDGISFIYLILGDENGVRFYFGVAKDSSYTGVQASPHTIGDDILGPAIRGNFRGCSIEEVSPEGKELILTKLRDREHAAGILEGVPGTDEENESFQGVDRLADVMTGDEFGFLLLARPYTEQEISKLEEDLFQLADALSPLVHNSLQVTNNIGKNNSENLSTGENYNYQENESFSHTNNDTDSHDTREDKSNQQQSNMTESTASQYSKNKSFNKSQGNPPSETASDSGGESGSIQKQGSYTFGQTISKGDTVSHSHTENNSIGESTSGNMSVNVGKSAGKTIVENIVSTRQMELYTKEASDWMRYIDEILLKRVDYGRGKGLFLSCGYLFASHKSTLNRLANTAISLYSGPKGNKVPLRFHMLPQDSLCRHSLSNMQIPLAIRKTQDNTSWCAGLSRLETGHSSFAGNWLSVHELGILTALPQKEIPGMALREEVEFGMNIPSVDEKNRIPLGNLVQDGLVQRTLPAFLDSEAFDKHMFVTGVTGSGKTTTCKNLLLAWKKPFLVIEPAKTEYRALKEICPDIVFFTPGKQDVAPFFLNPFELFPGEAITSRADMIKATLEAAFDMEAAIPQIMETAVYRAYTEKGWDVRTDEWLDANGEPMDPFADGVYAFPTMSDFWQAVKKVTKEEGFGERLQDEYMGSLKARIESLLVGSKGMMLDNPRSIDFNDLVTRKVVIELEEIKNGSEKSLLMGFILTNLLQAVQAHHRKNPNFRHITLVEEAHRLLSRYVPGDSMNKKQGVEVFSDMLAEVRKYGESLIIVDQIPDKMTPEVLKNTNTKIVHKLFARDDKDTIGDTISLSDDQKEFLSKLPTGRAIVFSQGWNKAVQVQMKDDGKTGEKEISNEEIHKLSLQYYIDKSVIKRGVLRGLECIGENWDKKTVEDYLWLMRGGQKALELCKKIFHDGNVKEKRFLQLKTCLIRLNKHAPMNTWITYLYQNCYEQDDAERRAVFFECMKRIVDEDDAEILLLQKNMDYLKFEINDDEENDEK